MHCGLRKGVLSTQYRMVRAWIYVHLSIHCVKLYWRLEKLFWAVLNRCEDDILFFSKLFDRGAMERALKTVESMCNYFDQTHRLLATAFFF